MRVRHDGPPLGSKLALARASRPPAWCRRSPHSAIHSTPAQACGIAFTDSSLAFIHMVPRRRGAGNIRSRYRSSFSPPIPSERPSAWIAGLYLADGNLDLVSSRPHKRPHAATRGGARQTASYPSQYLTVRDCRCSEIFTADEFPICRYRDGNLRDDALQFRRGRSDAASCKACFFALARCEAGNLSRPTPLPTSISTTEAHVDVKHRSPRRRWWMRPR